MNVGYFNSDTHWDGMYMCMFDGEMDIRAEKVDISSAI